MKTQMKMVLVAGASALALLSGASAQLVAVNAGDDGFTGWTQANSSGIGSQNGRFTAASGTSMDTSGISWGLYANSGQTAANIYTFPETLIPGNYVEISVSLGFIQNGGTVGFGLQNSSNVDRFETYYIGGHAVDSFKLNDAGGQENVTGATTSFSSSARSNGNFQIIRFTLGTSNTYSLSFDGASVTNTGLTIAASDISQIRIYNANAYGGVGSSGDFDQYFNSLTVVPEPGTYLAMGFAVLLVVFVARRRREA